ncbi:hypothetical protein LNV08_04490 [Paucibacter sp. TC2R-5]|uniref:hypothetical protein n=1 Tax=Paucibacter sp. TC2R-5 TaxID=2893555 RepID=UPI0021E509C4|nr:hypothetical protein [Paucibacter sp. TC2R-5]MCV2358226.1 hypothetical protein [Paucibacter sp. TC2R-5]
MNTDSEFGDQARWHLTIAMALAGAAALLLIASNSADEPNQNTQLLLDPPSAGAIATASAMDSPVPSASEVFAVTASAQTPDELPEGF